jgi:hypothetical protein
MTRISLEQHLKDLPATAQRATLHPGAVKKPCANPECDSNKMWTRRVTFSGGEETHFCVNCLRKLDSLGWLVWLEEVGDEG